MEKQNEKVERLRKEMESRLEAQRQETESRLEAQRQETEALRAERLQEQQLVALQARIDSLVSLVAATLLSEDERDAIEDAMADAAEGGDEAGFAAQMAALVEKFRSDRALARQLRRKYCR